MSSRSMYKYHLKVDGKVVLSDITDDLDRRQKEHQRRWPTGRIEKVGRATTHRSAWEWKQRQLEERYGRTG